MNIKLILIPFLSIALTACSGLPVVDHDKQTLENLRKEAPTLNVVALQNALKAKKDAESTLHLRPPEHLVVIDYSLPSHAPRMWTFNMLNYTLMRVNHVAHGSGSGSGVYATKFGNNFNSKMTSLGAFTIGEKYMGSHGYALRLNGLEPGVNSNAAERLVVLHQADYVTESYAGHSEGCPAVSSKSIQVLVSQLKMGDFLYSYYPTNKPR